MKLVGEGQGAPASLSIANNHLLVSSSAQTGPCQTSRKLLQFARLHFFEKFRTRSRRWPDDGRRVLGCGRSHRRCGRFSRVSHALPRRLLIPNLVLAQLSATSGSLHIRFLKYYSTFSSHEPLASGTTNSLRGRTKTQRRSSVRCRLSLQRAILQAEDTHRVAQGAAVVRGEPARNGCGCQTTNDQLRRKRPCAPCGALAIKATGEN